MELKQVEAQTQPTRETEDLGEFRARFATWEEDREKDIIHRGAFRDTIRRWRRSGKRIPLHWQHGSSPDKIIGHVDPMSLEETSDGLVGNGWVDLKNSVIGREVWRLIKGGVIGCSFGYLPTLAHKRTQGGRDLHELDVFEFTLTGAPMSFGTAVLGHKGALQDQQRSRAVTLERELIDGQLPDVPDAPQEPEPELEPEPVVIPDMAEQRVRAREAASYGQRLVRRGEESRLPDVPPEVPVEAPEPLPETVVPDVNELRARALKAEGLGDAFRRRAEEARLPELPPEPVVRPSEPKPEPAVPDVGEQRARARDAESYGSDLRRRAEEARLPDTPPAPQPPPERKLDIPDPGGQRRRASETESYGKALARRAEEARLPDVPDELVQEEPSEADLRIAQLEQRLAALELKRVQAETIDVAAQRERAQRVAREEEERPLMEEVKQMAGGMPGMLQMMLEQARKYCASEQDPEDVRAMQRIMAMLRSLGAKDQADAGKSLEQLLETKMTREPFSSSRTSNWVARAGGLPAYIQHIAHDLMDERGMSESQAIQMAIGVCKRWCRGGDKVSAETRGKACAAVAEWERLKAKSGKAVSAPADVQALQDVPDSGALADLLDQLSPEELAGLFEALYGRIVDRMDQMAPGKSLVAAAPGLSPEDADGTGAYRYVDPLRAQADNVALEFFSDGESLRKSPPPPKPAPKPEFQWTYEEARQKAQDEMLAALSGLDDI